MDDFEILKEDAHYLSWTHTFNDITAIQDIAEPLDPSFDESTLNTPLQCLLHKKKKEYIGSVAQDPPKSFWKDLRL